MSRREDVDSSIWDNDDFLALTDAEKVVYFWSFTNSRIGMAGIYLVSRRAMCMETGKTDQELAEVLAGLAEKRFCFYEDGVMWVRTRIKHLRQKGSKIAKSIRGDLEKVAGHPLADRLRAEYPDAEWVWEKGSYTALDPIDAPSMPHADPIDTPSMGSGQGRAGPGNTKREDDGRASARKPQPPKPDELPADLPERLRPVAELVASTLTRVADAKGAKPVTLAAVGRAVAAFPNHDHTNIVGDFEHYWVHGAGATDVRQDIVQTYRRRLHMLPAQPAAAVASTVRAINASADPALSRSEQLRQQRADHDRRTAERLAEVEAEQIEAERLAEEATAA